MKLDRKPEIDSPQAVDDNPLVVSPLLGEQRLHVRYAVDEEASLLLLDRGRSFKGRIVDLSLKGCRLKTNEPYSAGVRIRIEVTFSVNGIAFRFLGVVRWTDGKHLLGIRFEDSIARRRVQFAEVIAEMQATAAARQAREAAARAAQELAACEANQDAGHSAEPEPAEPSSSEAQAKQDRRAYVRYPVDTSAKIHFIKLGSVLNGRVVDLSLGGCRIHCNERFPVGIFTRVEVEFNLGGLPFRLGGVIQAIHDRQTVGIRFLDMSGRKREQLVRLIREIEQFWNNKLETESGE